MSDVAASERPKRDAAKKFLASAVADKEGGKGGERGAKDSMSLRQQSARSKAKDSNRDAGLGSAPRRVSGPGGSVGDDKKKRLMENLPKIAVDKGIRRLDLTALKKYKRHFGLKTAITSSNKEDLQAAVIRHFASQLRAEQGKTERSFLKMLRENKDR